MYAHHLARWSRLVGIGNTANLHILNVGLLMQLYHHLACRLINHRLADDALDINRGDMQLNDRIWQVILNATHKGERQECRQECEISKKSSHYFLFFFDHKCTFIPKWMSARFSLNNIFDCVREPVCTPSLSYCLIEVNLNPPIPNDTVAHTLGNI